MEPISANSLYVCNSNTLQEPDFVKSAINEAGELESVFSVTPFDDLLDKEEMSGREHDADVRDAQHEAISRLLGYVFRSNKPEDALLRLMLLTYCIKPSIFGGATLQQLGQIYGASKQRLNYYLDKVRADFNVVSRNQKSTAAKETSSANTTRQHELAGHKIKTPSTDSQIGLL